MSYSISCIHCQAVLKSAAPVRAGKKVRCPKCQQLFTTPAENTEPANAPAPITPQPALPEPLADDDEMAAAIAKLEGEQALGNKPSTTVPKPGPTPQAPAPAPIANADVSEEDEMAAAIAKLEGEQALGNKPAAPEPKPAPVVKTAPKVAAEPEEEIPEIDDDLVVPDEEEPRSNKKVRAKVEAVARTPKRREEDDSESEEPTAKKTKRRDKEEEERSPKKKKSRDINDDEEPPAKKKKSRDINDDEEPPAKKKKSRDEEEDEDGAFSAEPPAKAKKGPVENDYDEDDEEADKPRRVDKKKKKAGSPMLLILLIGGGILGLFACCGCGIGGYFLFASNPLVGKWEGDVFIVKLEFEFNRGGTGKLSFKTADGPMLGGQKIKAEEGTVHFNYTVTGRDPMILEIDPTRVEGLQGQVMFDKKDGPKRLRATVDGDNLTLTDVNPQFGRVAIPLKLRRVR
jgi:phage FluMu protein Com